ncbi:hypothetical protein CERSUDRAFT_111750 [Gelatoporia subvermispora B]|uniref:F-box domain-containing protein n=1 Tax=Ceriporiopsis subvermispora (strain B) TaxID=914234 RepID=M2R4H9_CERS8|nr:hypothetical protein CERSUDRAFT_111750 [Gelatoporia subvermispora B]
MVRIEEIHRVPDIFPHLRRLDIRRFSGSWAIDDEQIEELHHQQRRGSNARYSWAEMTYVSGHLDGLYILAFAKHIRRVDIHDLWLLQNNQGRLRAVLSAAQPTHLSLDLVHPRQSPRHSALPQLLDMSHHVLYLRLSMKWWSADGIDMEEFREHLLMTLRTLRLKHLHLVLIRPHGSRRHPVVTFMYEVDLELLAQNILDACPTLEFICFNLAQRAAHFEMSPSLEGIPRCRAICLSVAQARITALWRSA